MPLFFCLSDIYIVTSEAIEHRAEEFGYAGLVVGVGFCRHSLRYDAAHGHGAVSEHLRHSLQACRFHLVVGDVAAVVTETEDLLVEVGGCERYSHHASLGCIETDGGYGVAAYHVVAPDTLHKFRVCVNHIRVRPGTEPAGMVHELPLEVEVAHLVAFRVEIKYAVGAYRLLGYHVIANMKVFEDRAGSAHTHHVEGAVLRLYLAGLEIDVGERVEFRDHNLDVVGTDAVGDTHHILTFIFAANGVKLTRLNVIVDGVEKLRHHGDATRVADKKDIVAELFRTKMDVKCRTVVVYNQFGGGYYTSHGY